MKEYYEWSNELNNVLKLVKGVKEESDVLSVFGEEETARQ
jgi:hypothetical protein